MKNIGFSKTETKDSITFTTMKTPSSFLDYMTYFVWLLILALVVAFIATSEVDIAYIITLTISIPMLAIFALKIARERNATQEIVVSNDTLKIRKAGLFKPKEITVRIDEVKKVKFKVIGISLISVPPDPYVFLRSFFTLFTLEIPAIDAGEKYEDIPFFESLPKRGRVQIVEELNSIIIQ